MVPIRSKRREGIFAVQIGLAYFSTPQRAGVNEECSCSMGRELEHMMITEISLSLSLMIERNCILQLIVIALCLVFDNYVLLLSPAYNETVSLREGEKSNQTTASLDVKRTKMNESVERGCKKNKMWTNCADCELKCDEDEFRECYNACHEIRCECPAFLGFRRTASGKCIRKEDCPLETQEITDLPIVECPILEEFNECGTACEETCSNFGQPIICTQECVPGCFCKKGYVRENKAGCCVPSELCGAKEKNKTCGPNQEYRRCGTACPQTCDGIPENCIQKCVSGCFCKNGFVMDLDRCIPEISCHVVPRDCRENEIYRKCGSPCQELCGEQKKENCNQCVEGCFCKLGYVVEEKAGVCVKPEQCIPPKYTKCPGNETFTYCGGCEGTCQNQFTDCPEECGSPRCECLANRNYVRNEFGACIHINDCIIK